MLPQLEQPFLQILGQRHEEAEGAGGDGVGEGELSGVEGVSRGAAGVLLRLAAEGMGINFFAAEAVAEFRKVNADLMGAAGFEAAFEDGVMGKMLEGANVGDGAQGAW